jgi:cAMP phosphodiesterase
MFECSSPEVPDEVFCHLAFAIFAFLEPRQLLRANSVLADIVKMAREDKVKGENIMCARYYKVTYKMYKYIKGYVITVGYMSYVACCER